MIRRQSKITFHRFHRCSRMTRNSSSLNFSWIPNRSLSSAVNSDIQAVQKELQTLRLLLQEQRECYDRLSQQIQSQSTTMENAVDDIHTKVNLLAFPLERLSSLASIVVNNSERVVSLIHRMENYSQGWLNSYTVTGFIVTGLIIWRYRNTMYDRTSEEVADLASRTLQQERLQRSLQDTLGGIANSPETLQTLHILLQNLLRDPKTLQEFVKLICYALELPDVKRSLLVLLQHVLNDPTLQQQTGEFLLKSLNHESVRPMLEEQSQSLLRSVVSDKSVQQATGNGLYQSLWHGFLPSVLSGKTDMSQLCETQIEEKAS
jgi:hypothetical protein